MKKRIWITIGAAAVIIALGVFVYLVYFTGYDYSMADDATLDIGGYTVSVGADGSGESAAKEYSNKNNVTAVCKREGQNFPVAAFDLCHYDIKLSRLASYLWTF